MHTEPASQPLDSWKSALPPLVCEHIKYDGPDWACDQNVAMQI